MNDRRSAFLAGERPDDVALFLAESYVADDRLAEFGESVDGGVVLVVDGERGRNAFRAATGTDAMAFAKDAMATEGEIDRELTGGVCPESDSEQSADHGASADSGDSTDHDVQFVFAFAEEQNEDVGGIYAEGDVVHAYARCACGAVFSDRWVA